MSEKPLSTMASASDFGSEDTGSTPVGAADLFLILHKVRGEPAFDIAQIIGEDSEGEIWIIPTSGHRAYPYIGWELKSPLDIGPFTGDPRDIINGKDDWADWPDHYTVSKIDGGYGHREYRKSAVNDLLNRLGLNRKPSLIRRMPK